MAIGEKDWPVAEMPQGNRRCCDNHGASKPVCFAERLESLSRKIHLLYPPQHS
jgi:hypothetical protein